MIILNPEADADRHEDLVGRVRQLIEDGGGEVVNVSSWGRRKIAYPMRKQADGVFVTVSCFASAEMLDEISRVLAINKDVVLRAMPIRVTPGNIEAVRVAGIPEPVDDRPEGEGRQRGGRRGGDRGDRGDRGGRRGR